MIRLSCLSLWKGSCVLLWLKLLRDHFEDLLYQPILKCHDKHSTSLEGSPFQVIVIGREHIDALCTCHLQRQVNLLFLKCCFQLVRLNNEFVQIEISSTSEMQNDKIQCCTKGLSELYEWFENHVSVVSLEKYDTHLDGGGVSHSEFALKFLQLYMDEVCAFSFHNRLSIISSQHGLFFSATHLISFCILEYLMFDIC